MSQRETQLGLSFRGLKHRDVQQAAALLTLRRSISWQGSRGRRDREAEGDNYSSKTAPISPSQWRLRRLAHSQSSRAGLEEPVMRWSAFDKTECEEPDRQVRCFCNWCPRESSLWERFIKRNMGPAHVVLEGPEPCPKELAGDFIDHVSPCDVGTNVMETW